MHVVHTVATAPSVYGDPDLFSTVVSQKSGGAWQSSQVLNTFPPDANGVKLAVGADGFDRVMFEELSGDLKLATGTSSGWSVEQVFPQSGSSESIDDIKPDIAMTMGPGNQPHLVYDVDSAPAYAEYATKVGGTWQRSTVTTLTRSAETADGFDHPQLVVSSTNEPFVRFSTSNQLNFARRSGGNWQVAAITGNPGGRLYIDANDHGCVLRHVGSDLVRDCLVGTGLQTTTLIPGVNADLVLAVGNLAGGATAVVVPGALWTNASGTWTSSSISKPYDQAFFTPAGKVRALYRDLALGQTVDTQP